MPSADKTKAFAADIRGRDWNRVLSPALFGESGLEALADMIEAHGIEALDLAVRDFLARSKADRRIKHGHVRSWRFFGPYCNEQSERNGASCAE